MDLQANDDICEMFDGRRFGQPLKLNVEFDWLKIGSQLHHATSSQLR